MNSTELQGTYNSVILELFHGQEGKVLNSFYEVSGTLKPQPNQGSIKSGGKNQPILMNIDVKTLTKKIANRIQQYIFK